MTAQNPHAEIIDQVNRSVFMPSQLAAIERRANMLIGKGDLSAQDLLDAVASAAQRDRCIAFLSFCPGGVLRNRLDVMWRKQGNCTFEFHPGNGQSEDFKKIAIGNLLVLKKVQQYGETMRLYGHGRVLGVSATKSGNILQVDWSMRPQHELEVPFMGCDRAVNWVETSVLQSVMPKKFWDWLRVDSAVDAMT